ncbi:uncharacterized protein ACNS7B_002727 [Menidia menidia]
MSWKAVFLLFLRLSAAGGEKEKKELTGVVGGNITLPDSILETGFLHFYENHIASVMTGIFESYVKNVHWKKETGLFTITDLQKNNSGDYKLEWGSIFKFLYWLRVFDPVPTPKVSRLNSSSDSCLLLCSVGENTTLQWLKGQQILNQSSSASSLRLSVDKQDFNSSFSCVASSPAENKTVPVNVTTSCALSQTKNDDWDYRVIIAVVAVFLVAVGLVYGLVKCNKNMTNGQTEADSVGHKEVQYTQIQMSDTSQVGNGSGSSGPEDGSDVITV